MLEYSLWLGSVPPSGLLLAQPSFRQTADFRAIEIALLIIYIFSTKRMLRN